MSSNRNRETGCQTAPARARLYVLDGAEYKPSGDGYLSIVKVDGDYDKVLFLNHLNCVIGFHYIYKWANLRIYHGVDNTPHTPVCCQWVAPVFVGEDLEKLPVTYIMRAEFDNVSAGKLFYDCLSWSIVKARVMMNQMVQDAKARRANNQSTP